MKGPGEWVGITASAGDGIQGTAVQTASSFTFFYGVKLPSSLPIVRSMKEILLSLFKLAILGIWVVVDGDKITFAENFFQ